MKTKSNQKKIGHYIAQIGLALILPTVITLGLYSAFKIEHGLVLCIFPHTKDFVWPDGDRGGDIALAAIFTSAFAIIALLLMGEDQDEN